MMGMKMAMPPQKIATLAVVGLLNPPTVTTSG
jgi:hypothetical protein